MTRGYSSSIVTAMYGNDLSSRRRTLNGGRWRLTRFLLEMKRLHPAPGDDYLEVGDPRHEPWNRGLVVAAALLKIRAHARPQRLRLADVEDVTPLVPKEVDALRVGIDFSVPLMSATSVTLATA